MITKTAEEQHYGLTASEDGHVHVHTLQKPYRHVCSIPHQAPTIALAGNNANTILATADVAGNLCFWRRYK